MAFKLSKAQLTERDVLAAELRKRGAALNIAIVAFNQAIQPLSQVVGESLEAYNAINHANFVVNTGSAYIAGGQGLITGTYEGNRNIQIGAKIIF